MKKNSINLKVFLIVAAFFIIFTTVTMSLQSLFIEKFYLSKKTEAFQNNFNNIAAQLKANNYDLTAIQAQITDFENNNNAKIASVYIAANKVMIQSRDSADPSESPSAQKPMMKIYDNEKVAVIADAVSEMRSEPNLLNSVVNQHETVYFKSSQQVNEVQNIIAASPIVENGNVTTILLAVSSLQPIGEATAVMREFYVYFYILALVLILLLSYILSKMISKPLINLNKIALKMSNFNFSVRYTAKSNDEIGNLGKTLNFLSEKLGNALSELKVTNEKLVDEIAKEKQLEKMRREFVAGVSHELKTPISIINGYAEALIDDVLEDDKDTLLHIIMDESQKMSLLVNDMLDLSTLESGSYQLVLREFSIEELINSLYSKYITHIKARNLNLILGLNAVDSFTLGDEFRLEQVVTNLLDNALKHTFEGKNIYINTYNENENVVVEIINEGKPIPEEEISNIWEKFYKLDKSRNRNMGGTGIGLSIVKDILELHHSSFGVENTEKGVRFWFTLKNCSLDYEENEEEPDVQPDLT